MGASGRSRQKSCSKGQSIGNGQTIDFTQTGVIAKDAEGKYTLSIEGTDTVYTKVAE